MIKELNQEKKDSKEPKSASSIKKGTVGSSSSATAARSTSPTKKPTGDALESELKEHESKIIEQLVNIQVYQEIIIGTKQFRMPDEFAA